MKTVFVVLALFVGYNSGVIVHSVVSKDNNQTKTLNSTKEILKVMNLDRSHKIHEKEVLQTSADKETSLNERSFVFINQRFKTPLRNQLYNTQTHNLNKPFTISERLPQVNVIPSSFAQENLSPLKELFMPNIKIKGNLNSKYSPPSYINRESKTINMDEKYTLERVVQEAEPKSKHPIDVGLNKIDIDNLNKKYLLSQDSTKLNQSDKPSMMNLHAGRINYNYGFPTYEMPASRSNELFQKQDDAEGNLITDNVGSLSPLDVNDEDDKLLERYIKETLEDFDISDTTDNDIKCQKCKAKGKNSKVDGKCECIKKSYSDANYIKQMPDGYQTNIKLIGQYAAPDENDNWMAYNDNNV